MARTGLPEQARITIKKLKALWYLRASVGLIHIELAEGSMATLRFALHFVVQTALPATGDKTCHVYWLLLSCSLTFTFYFLPN